MADKQTGKRKCPTCGKPHAAYDLFPPACQHPNDGCTYFIDGKPSN